jgi:inner membrane protein
MDSITHIALGAVIGEAFAGKRIGKRALVYGALMQSLPDIDVIASFWLSPADNLLAHRGITHSFIFVLITSTVMGYLAYRWHKASGMQLKNWILFFGLEIFTHLILDAFNNYGVGWFEPFSSARISFHTLFVADPFLTFWILVACIALFVLNQKSSKRKFYTYSGLTWATLYLIYAIINKTIASNSIVNNLRDQKISYNRYFITPTPLNTWLWYVVVEHDSGYQIAYRSVFDKNEGIDFKYFPKRESLLDSIRDQDELKQLIRFSQNYYTIENAKDTLIFNDLRFGQIMGWRDPHAKFVFHYYLKHPQQNLLVIQRGRFSGWNKETLKELIERIEGEPGDHPKN